MTAVKSKGPYLALGCVLFLVAGIGACIKFPLLCLMVPCDRSLTVTVSPVNPKGEPLHGCSLALYRPPESPEPVWEKPIEEGRAGFIIGPWTEQYSAQVRCPGYEPSQVLQVELDDSDVVSLGSVTMNP